MNRKETYTNILAAHSIVAHDEYRDNRYRDNKVKVVLGNYDQHKKITTEILNELKEAIPNCNNIKLIQSKYQSYYLSASYPKYWYLDISIAHKLEHKDEVSQLVVKYNHDQFNGIKSTI